MFVIFILLLFALDKETHQEITASYFIATWIISGGYLWSFLKNASDIFGGGAIFKLLQGFLTRQVQDKTGVDLKEMEAENGIFGS